jgi:hypothetical protein
MSRPRDPNAVDADPGTGKDGELTRAAVPSSRSKIACGDDDELESLTKPWWSTRDVIAGVLATSTS